MQSGFGDHPPGSNGRLWLCALTSQNLELTLMPRKCNRNKENEVEDFCFLFCVFWAVHCLSLYRLTTLIFRGKSWQIPTHPKQFAVIKVNLGFPFFLSSTVSWIVWDFFFILGNFKTNKEWAFFPKQWSWLYEGGAVQEESGSMKAHACYLS